MIAPTLEDLRKAHTTFAEREPRDLFYRAATELVGLALAGKTQISLAEAVAVLLQTWNVSFYRFHGRFTTEHFEEVESLIDRKRPILARFRERDITSLSPHEEAEIVPLFQESEQLLGPVGAAKAFHLLAPNFFPIWDRKIAQAYKCSLQTRGTNGQKYFRFMRMTQEHAAAIRNMGFGAGNALKALDEYNYCRFTNKWMT